MGTVCTGPRRPGNDLGHVLAAFSLGGLAGRFCRPFLPAVWPGQAWLSRQPSLQRSMKPDDASAARQRTAVVGSMPARCAIRVAAIPPRAGIASSTWVVSRSMASRSSAGRSRRLLDDAGRGESTGRARAEPVVAELEEAELTGSVLVGALAGS